MECKEIATPEDPKVIILAAVLVELLFSNIQTLKATLMMKILNPKVILPMYLMSNYLTIVKMAKTMSSLEVEILYILRIELDQKF